MQQTSSTLPERSAVGRSGSTTEREAAANRAFSHPELSLRYSCGMTPTAREAGEEKQERKQGKRSSQLRIIQVREEVRFMKYEKPEVHLVTTAVSSIQDPMEKVPSGVVETLTTWHTISAYAADE